MQYCIVANGFCRSFFEFNDDVQSNYEDFCKEAELYIYDALNFLYDNTEYDVDVVIVRDVDEKYCYLDYADIDEEDVVGAVRVRQVVKTDFEWE